MQDYNTTESRANLSFILNVSQPVIHPRHVFIIAVYCLIMFVSVVGNSLVLAVVYRNENKRMRTTSNYLIANMSCSELLLTVFNIPLAITGLASENQFIVGGSLGNILCKLTELLFYLSIAVSLLSLGFITVDRFLLVLYPHKAFITAKRAQILIGTMWLIGIIFSIPLAAKSTIYEYRHVKACFIKSSASIIRAYVITCLIVFVVLPLTTMVVLYSSIVAKHFRQKTPGENSAVNLEHSNKRNRKVFVMLVSIVTLAIVCWLPYWLMVLACFLTLEFASCNSVVYLHVLAFANCALNPCTYAVFNESIRVGFYRVLCAVVCPNWVRRKSCQNQVFPE